MNPDSFMPLSASPRVVLGVFAALLIGFDILLVRCLKLGKVAWKRVDYIWLGVGALGLIGAVGQVRMASASAQLTMQESRAAAALNLVKGLAELYAKDPGAICRTFVRSEYSPPPEEFQRAQNEYDAACAWAKQMTDNLAKRASSPPEPIDRASLPSRPVVSDGGLRDMFRGLDNQFEYFEQNMDAYRALREKSQQTPIEQGLVFLGPFLLAAALAVRITKVTGEIALEA